mmetsp:Transcript_45452/g.89961  ORF Transcript_45452/g.89961 Transcript_45452/m.89961 type:complete len:379 (+) Transcript_45452:68-1204(+)
MSFSNSRPSQCTMSTSLAGSDQGSVGTPGYGNNLTRTTSRKQQKAQKTSMFYRELTDALHSKVADFMVGVDELDDSEDVKHEITKLIDELGQQVQEECNERRSAQGCLEARCDKLEQHVAAMFGKFDSIETAHGKAEDEARNRHTAFRDDVQRQINQAMQEHHCRILREMERQIDLASRRFEETAASLEQLGEHVMGGGPKVEKMQEQLRACEQHCSVLDGHCVDSLQRCHQLQDRFDVLDGRYNEEVGALMNERGAIRNELRRLSSRGDTMEQHRDAVQECFDTMDQKHARLAGALGELAKNATGELQATRDEMDQICNVIWAVSKAWGARLRNSRSPRRSARSHGEEPTSPGAAAGNVPMIPLGHGSPRQPFLAGA